MGLKTSFMRNTVAQVLRKLTAWYHFTPRELRVRFQEDDDTVRKIVNARRQGRTTMRARGTAQSSTSRFETELEEQTNNRLPVIPGRSSLFIDSGASRHLMPNWDDRIRSMSEYREQLFTNHHDDEPSSDSSEIPTDASLDEGEKLPVLMSSLGQDMENPQDQIVFYSSIYAPNADEVHNHCKSLAANTIRGKPPAEWNQYKVHANPSCGHVSRFWDTMSIKCVQSEYEHVNTESVLPWCDHCSNTKDKRQRCFMPNSTNDQAWLYMFNTNDSRLIVPWEFRRNTIHVNGFAITGVQRDSSPPGVAEPLLQYSQLGVFNALNQYKQRQQDKITIERCTTGENPADRPSRAPYGSCMSPVTWLSSFKHIELQADVAAVHSDSDQSLHDASDESFHDHADTPWNTREE